MGKPTGKIIQTLVVPGYAKRYSVTDVKTGKVILVTSNYKLALAELYRNDDKIVIFPLLKKAK